MRLVNQNKKHAWDLGRREYETGVTGNRVRFSHSYLLSLISSLISATMSTVFQLNGQTTFYKEAKKVIFVSYHDVCHREYYINQLNSIYNQFVTVTDLFYYFVHFQKFENKLIKNQIM